jgi:hypothetical protein
MRRVRCLATAWNIPSFQMSDVAVMLMMMVN